MFVFSESLLTAETSAAATTTNKNMRRSGLRMNFKTLWLSGAVFRTNLTVKSIATNKRYHFKNDPIDKPKKIPSRKNFRKIVAKTQNAVKNRIHPSDLLTAIFYPF